LTSSSKENCATFISGNQYDRLTQQSFLEAAASLSNSSRERSINSTERQAQAASAMCKKNSQADLSSTQLVSAKFTERQAHRPQLKFLTQPVPQTVVQLHRIDNSKKPEPVTRHIFGLFDLFYKYATFELSLMSNDENKFLLICQIQHIKNA
jgi:hypothetical protein